MTVGLVLAVLALIISAIVWALGANSSNPHLAGRGKLGVLVALGAAIVGASMTVGLVLAVLALIISSIVWALGANSSNPHLAGRGKLGVLVALGAAIVCGASVTLVNFFWNVGQQV